VEPAAEVEKVRGRRSKRLEFSCVSRIVCFFVFFFSLVSAGQASRV
jgi:hypothetical protein